MEEERTRFHFRIHILADDRLLGFGELDWVLWSSGIGNVRLGIGAESDRRKGYGTDAMNLILRSAFMELNLHRVSLDVFDYNPRGVKSYEKAGFRHEGRAREMILRDGRRYDVLYMGILRNE